MDKFNAFAIIKKCFKDVFVLMPIVVIGLMAIEIVAALSSVVSVYSSAKLLDTASQLVSGASDLRGLSIWCAVVVLTYVVDFVCVRVRYMIDNTVVVKKLELFHDRLADFVVDLSLEAAEKPEISDSFWRAKDAVYQDRMKTTVLQSFQIIPSAFRVIGSIIVLSTYNILLVPIAVLSILPSVIIRIIVSRKGYAFQRAHTKAERRVGYLRFVLTHRESVREMRLSGFANYLFDKFFTEYDLMQSDGRRFQFKTNLYTSIVDLSRTIFYALSVLFCVLLLQRNELTIGAFGVCLTAFISMQGTAFSFISIFSEIMSSCRYANDYYSFFDNSSESSTGEPCGGNFEELTAENITFSYPNAGTSAVQNLNLNIKKGEKIVIVGENGSGKTTLAKILMSLYEPNDGKVTYNGIPVDTLKRESVFSHFSLAAQNFVKYSLSVRENIAVGDISRIEADNDLISQLDRVGLDTAIRNVGGIDTLLGVEFGCIDLSGGEWQKLAIARACFANGELLFFDEPTAALDPMIEREILTQLLTISNTSSVVVISHRIGICRIADRIIVMKNGNIVESGSFNDLIANDGEFKRLWTEQAKWYQ
ncbi:MAG: ABC transporter ATP-binding protein/permease [Oscillospiraceae bacterium]|jgi:ABC-type bacteriocin/lantibiotic exporter with double-glycine peptidase domain|nr:ABC transporter ATP-binding protein/permease [Oscillospiraceae bacterium]